SVGPTLAGADDGDLVHHGEESYGVVPPLHNVERGSGVRSPAPGVHLSVWIGAQRIDPIQRAPVRHPESLLRAAIGAALPRLPDERRELLIGGTAAQRLAQIDAPRGVETQEPGPVGGDPATVAGTAERRRDRGAYAERGPVRAPEAPGRSA